MAVRFGMLCSPDDYWRPGQEIIGSIPSLVFPATTLTKVDPGGDTVKIRGRGRQRSADESIP